MAQATMPKAPTGRTKSGRKATTRGAIGRGSRPTNVQLAEASMRASRHVTDTYGLHRVRGGWELCAPEILVPGDRLVGRDGWQIQV